MAQLQLIVVTPEATVLDQHTDFVALPLSDGEIGIAVNHAPLIARLGNGELRFRQAGDTPRYFVAGGFVQIADNTVCVMTSRAMRPEEIDIEQVRELLAESLRRKAHSPELIDARARAVTQARAQLRLVRHAPPLAK